MIILAFLFTVIVFWLPLGFSLYKGFSLYISILFALLGLLGGTFSVLFFFGSRKE